MGIAGSSVVAVALVAVVAAESDKGTSKQAAQVLSAIQSTVLATYYTCALASPTSTNTQVIPTATACPLTAASYSIHIRHREAGVNWR